MAATTSGHRPPLDALRRAQATIQERNAEARQRACTEPLHLESGTPTKPGVET